MSLNEFAGVFLAAALVNHLVLVQLLGVSAFFAYSADLRRAGELSLGLLLVMPLSAALTLPLYRFVLIPLGLEFMLLITAVASSALVTAALLRVVRHHFPLSLRRHGQAMLLLSGNSGVIGFLLQRGDTGMSLLSMLVAALGAAAGFALLLVAFAALRQRLQTADAPTAFRGPALSLLSAGIMAMGLMGLAGPA